tara:strand:- start:496 stop:687 length:192 start_codon:yes stop_codon:yes gene_type:complete
MIKDFKIIEILNAVNSIDKIQKEREKVKILEKKDYSNKHEPLIPNNQAKLNKSEILVLDQMIE